MREPVHPIAEGGIVLHREYTPTFYLQPSCEPRQMLVFPSKFRTTLKRLMNHHLNIFDYS